MNKSNYRFKWIYNNNEIPNDCCYDCRMKKNQFPDMMISDDLWEQINPTNQKGKGILCPTCMTNRLKYLGLYNNLELSKKQIIINEDKIKSNQYPDVEIITVNYNTPDYIYRMYFTIRTYVSKSIKIRIIDGSDKHEYMNKFTEIEEIDNNFTVNRIGFNIHHGNGMDYAIRTSKYNKILILDSDVYIKKEGFIDKLLKIFDRMYYGIGEIFKVDKYGINNIKGNIKYLHPRCMFLNKVQYFNYRRFKNHGAPCIEAMSDINKRNDSNKLINFSRLKEYVHVENRGTRQRYGINDVLFKDKENKRKYIELLNENNLKRR